MSSIDDEADSDELDGEDSYSDDNDMGPTPAGAEAAAHLRQKRMAARPSTIVQVNTSALDMHLRSMKKQLLLQAKEIANPVWLDGIRQDLSRMPDLNRRLEHCELDINAIRGAIYSRNDADLSTVAGVDAGRFLLAEIEATRAVTRRIELHQAIEAKVFGQIQEIQTNMKKMKEGITRQSSMGGGGGGNINSAALNEKLALFKKEMDTLHDNQAQGKAAVLLKLTESEKKNREITDESIHRYGHKLQAGIMKFISDLKAGHNNTSTKLDEVEKVAHRLREIHAQQAFVEATEVTNRVMESWVFSICRKAFVKWRDMDPYGMRPVGEKLQGLMVNVWLKFTTHHGFNKWKSVAKAMNRREVLRGHLKNIVSRWKRISFRDVSNYFIVWKRNAIYMSYLSREAQLRKERLPIAKEPLTQLGEMCRRMGADTDGKVLLLAGYVGASASRLERVGLNLKHTDEDLKKVTQQMNCQRTELSTQFSERCEVIEGQAKFFKTYATEKMDHLNGDLKNVRSDVDGLLNGSTSAVVKLEDRLIAMEKSVQEQNKKISNLLVLNGDMLERIATTEKDQVSLKTHVETIEKRFNEFEAATTKTFDRLQEDLQTGKDGQIFLDNNMRELKTAVGNAVNEVRRMSDLQHVLSDATEQRNREVAENLKRSDHVLNKISDHPPTPEEVVKLCLVFEQRALEVYSTAQYSTITAAMSSELALEISLTANRLATDVANSADMDVITSKILGPRPAPPASTAPVLSLGNQTGGTSSKYQQQTALNTTRQTLGTYNSSANLKTNFNKSASDIRDSLLFAFMDEFNAILTRNQTQQLGSVKIEAQAIFKRRFLGAVDLALSRIPTVNFNGNRSAVATVGAGLTTSNGTNCIACDRPMSSTMTGGVGTPDDNRVGLTAAYARHTGALPQAPGHLKPITKDIPLSETAEADIKKRLCTEPDETILTVARPASAGIRRGSIKVDLNSHTDVRSGEVSPVPTAEEAALDSPNNFIKLPSGYYDEFMTDDISTPALSRSTSMNNRKSGKKVQRPATAGASRSRNQPQGEDAAYVMRGGYKMPVTFESETISQALVDRFQKDVSISGVHKYGVDPRNKMAVSKSNDVFRMVQYAGSRKQGSARGSDSPPPMEKRRLVPTGALLSNQENTEREYEALEASVEREKLIEELSKSRTNSFNAEYPGH